MQKSFELFASIDMHISSRFIGHVKHTKRVLNFLIFLDQITCICVLNLLVKSKTYKEFGFLQYRFLKEYNFWISRQFATETDPSPELNLSLNWNCVSYKFRTEYDNWDVSKTKLSTFPRNLKTERWTHQLTNLEHSQPHLKKQTEVDLNSEVIKVCNRTYNSIASYSMSHRTLLLIWII